MNLKNAISIFFLLIGITVFAQETKVDTSFHNTYYDMRQEIYDAMPERKGEVIFLGNSITERINWSELFDNGKVINRGIGGDNCWGVYNRLGEVLASQPRKIFLLIGINDIGRGIPVDMIARKFEEILNRINADSPKTKVVLQTVIPIDEENLWYDYMKGKSPQIVELNLHIKKLAGKYNLPLIDLYEAFDDGTGNLKSELASDGLHLNGKGYMHWVRVIRSKGIKMK